MTPGPLSKPTHEEVSALVIEALNFSGRDKYGRSLAPEVAVVQDTQFRCVVDCQCNGCVTWRALAKPLLELYIAREDASAEARFNDF